MTTFYWAPRKSNLLTAQDVADAVWDAQTSDHTVNGSFGALVRKLLTLAQFIGLK